MENPFDATLEEFAAENYTHIECFWSRCRVTRLRPISWLPRISMGLTIAQLFERLRRSAVALSYAAATRFGKPLGRRG